MWLHTAECYRGLIAVQRIAADATLRLTVQQQLPFGESLRIAGSGDALGNWDPASAPSETPPCCRHLSHNSTRYLVLALA